MSRRDSAQTEDAAGTDPFQAVEQATKGGVVWELVCQRRDLAEGGDLSGVEATESRVQALPRFGREIELRFEDFHRGGPSRESNPAHGPEHPRHRRGNGLAAGE